MTICTMQGPVETAIGWGVFGTAEDGKTYIHFHAVIMDKRWSNPCGNVKAGSAPVLGYSRPVDSGTERFES